MTNGRKAKQSPLQYYSYGLMEFASKDINGYFIRVAESGEPG
jgi:hypothetical protein